MLTLDGIEVYRSQDGDVIIRLRDAEAQGSISRQLPADREKARRVLDEAITKLTEARAELAQAVHSDLPDAG